MPSAAAVSIYAFGASALLVGLHDLLYTQDALNRMALPAASTGPAKGNALAAIAMGLYYTLAAWQENRVFFALTVPMRTLTTIVFWRLGGDWRTVSVWEGAGAASTALALLLARRR